VSRSRLAVQVRIAGGCSFMWMLSRACCDACCIFVGSSINGVGTHVVVVCCVSLVKVHSIGRFMSPRVGAYIWGLEREPELRGRFTKARESRLSTGGMYYHD